MEQFYSSDFIPRYSMVSFHQMPYSEVYKKGEKQYKILDKILAEHDPKNVDKELAKTFINGIY